MYFQNAIIEDINFNNFFLTGRKERWYWQCCFLKDRRKKLKSFIKG